MTDVQLLGMNAGAQLMENAVFHALNAVLLMFFLWLATERLWESAAVSALFAVHPLHVESVAWISERKDVLSTFFFLVCLIAYTWYVRRVSRAAYIASIVALALGLLAKPMLVTAPVLLLLLDYWPFRRFNLTDKIPYALCIVPSVIATLIAQRGAMATETKVALLPRVANAAISYVKYVAKTFWPANLSIVYPFPARIDPRIAIACALIVIGITAAVVVYRRALPFLFVGWIWFIVALVPVIGIVQVGLQAMADRYTYIPHIGLFIAIVWTAAHFLPQQRTMLAATAAIVTVAFAAVAHAQVAYWKDSATLFAHALSVTSNNKLAHVNFGAALLDKGDYAAAEREYRLAEGFQPASIVSNGLGIALLKQGKLAAAVSVIGHADDAGVHNNLAAELAKKGDDQGAIREYEIALKIDPNSYDAHMNIGAALSRAGRNSEAEVHFSKAAQLQPLSPEPRIYLALLQAHEHRFSEAQQNVRQAMAINHDASNRLLIDAIRIPSRPTAIDEYLDFLQQQSGAH
jgi:Flp pilus assembly protein TadD